MDKRVLIRLSIAMSVGVLLLVNVAATYETYGRDGYLHEKLQAAVEAGKITQEQADAAKGILTGIVRGNPDASGTQDLMQAAEWIQDLAEIRPDGKGRSAESIKGDLGDVMRK